MHLLSRPLKVEKPSPVLDVSGVRASIKHNFLLGDLNLAPAAERNRAGKCALAPPPGDVICSHFMCIGCLDLKIELWQAEDHTSGFWYSDLMLGLSGPSQAEILVPCSV